MPTSLRDVIAASRHRQRMQRPESPFRQGAWSVGESETTFVLRADDSFEVAEENAASPEDQR